MRIEYEGPEIIIQYEMFNQLFILPKNRKDPFPALLMKILGSILMH